MTDPVLDELCGAGRDEVPLAFLDLIERNTLDLELASWLVACVAGGASWITGSGSGGIGKTTIMRALLSFVPAGTAFAEALPGKVANIGPPRKCVVSHELSDHTPPTYLWNQDLRDFFALSGAGHILVGNGQADHVLVYTAADGLRQGPHRNPAAEADQRRFLEAALRGSARSVQDLRAAFLERP